MGFLEDYGTPVISVLLVLTMLGMGASTDWELLKGVHRRYKAVLVGFATQFGLSPLVTYLFVRLFDLSDPQALGALILACVPGNGGSAFLTRVCYGDLELSIFMTMMSVVLALGMTPLLIFIYTPEFTSKDLDLDYVSIVISLLMVTVPVLMGIGLRMKKEAMAEKLSNAANLFGGIMLIGVFAAVLIDKESRDDLGDVSDAGWVLAVLLNIQGLCVGYLGSRVANLPGKSHRTVGLETGMQNITVALTIISTNFDDDAFHAVVAFPIAYALMGPIVNVAWAGLFRFGIGPADGSPSTSNEVAGASGSKSAPPSEEPQSPQIIPSTDHEPGPPSDAGLSSKSGKSGKIVAMDQFRQPVYASELDPSRRDSEAAAGAAPVGPAPLAPRARSPLPAVKT